jgi:hypothetical protein
MRILIATVVLLFALRAPAMQPVMNIEREWYLPNTHGQCGFFQVHHIGERHEHYETVVVWRDQIAMRLPFQIATLAGIAGTFLLVSALTAVYISRRRHHANAA